LTNGDKINTRTPGKPCILIAPLDWGLGHATRCIPIIKYLIEQDCHVILAASGKPASLLTAEFPKVELLPLPGYGLHYSASSRLNVLKILSQLPKILISIKQEHRWLDALVKTRQINMVISDCRFGLRHKNVFSVLMTHQLAIQSPIKWVKQQLRAWNYRFINRFNECWVPDEKGFPNLAGEISHPPKLPSIPVKYIGCLSRFTRLTASPEKEYDAVIILSGPEPQRTILENKLVKELASNKNALALALIRGLPDDANSLRIQGVDVFNHLPAIALEKIIHGARLIISRSGYTTVMDMLKLGKRTVLVPTPGQPEQEYLGRYLSQQQWCACMRQQDFSLADALQLASSFAYSNPGGLHMESYKEHIGQTIGNLPRVIFAPKLSV